MKLTTEAVEIRVNGILALEVCPPVYALGLSQRDRDFLGAFLVANQKASDVCRSY